MRARLFMWWWLGVARPGEGWGGGGRRRRDCSAAVPTQYSSNKNKGTGRREVFEKGTRQYPHCRPVAKRLRRVMEWLWDLALRLKGKWTLTVLTTSGPPHRLPPPPALPPPPPPLSVCLGPRQSPCARATCLYSCLCSHGALPLQSHSSSHRALHSVRLALLLLLLTTTPRCGPLPACG